MANEGSSSTTQQNQQTTDVSNSGAGGGAAIGLISNIVTTWMNNKFQRKQWEREVAHEQKTYDRNRADYLSDLANERLYNSPQQQMARLQQAGLNPNLMSEGALSTGNSSSAAPMPMGNNIGMAPAFASDFADGIATVSGAAVNAFRSRFEAAKAYADANLQSELGVSEREFRPIKKSLLNAQIAKENGQTDLYIQQAAKVIEETAIISIKKSYTANKEQAELDTMKAGVAKMWTEVDKITADKNKSIAEKELALAKATTEVLLQEYQQVLNKKAKVETWSGLVKDICLSVSSLGIAASSFIKIFKNGINSTDMSNDDKQRAISILDEFDRSIGGTIDGQNIPNPLEF